MQTGYFASVLTMRYRETEDGRLVTSRRLLPLLPPRWFLVSADAQAAFERRAKLSHVASMLGLVVGLRVASPDPSIRGAALVIAVMTLLVMPVLQWWETAALPPFPAGAPALKPLRSRELNERQTRAMGVPTLRFFVAISFLMAIPQGIVAVVDGPWWSWLGLLIFSSLGVYFMRALLRLQAEQRSAATT